MFNGQLYFYLKLIRSGHIRLDKCSTHAGLSLAALHGSEQMSVSIEAWPSGPMFLSFMIGARHVFDLLRNWRKLGPEAFHRAAFLQVLSHAMPVQIDYTQRSSLPARPTCAPHALAEVLA